MLSGGSSTRIIIAGLGLSTGIAVLCFALLCFFQVGDFNSLRHAVRSDIAAFDRKLRDDRGRNEQISYEMAELRDVSNRNAQQIAQGFSELKESYAVLNEQLRNTVSTVSNFQTARTFAAQQRGFQQRPFAMNGYSVTSGPQAASAVQQTRPPAEGYRHFPEALEDAPDAVAAEAAVVPANDVPVFGDQLRYDNIPIPPAPPVPPPSSNLDRLVISLEPVIDLFTSKTAHYRLYLSMAKPEGGDVAQDVLFHHADRTGLRSDFDVFAAREALQLVARLRQRDPALNIFMAIGPSTLQSESALHRILENMREDSEAAGGVVFELPHAMLAGLSDAGLEGLARLARAGVQLSLSNVAIAGIDLAPLATLNVKYLSLAAATAGGVEGPSQQLITFAQGARVARIQTIVTGVVDRRVVQKLTKVTRFASGPAFAEPRRVKTDAGSSAAHAGVQGIGAAA
jgi:EAL domain-containing protein (putative c-di-GMP-specific phosphodiesterase class I)